MCLIIGKRYNMYSRYLCDRYLSNICDRYVMGPNSYMLQICDRYFHTYILKIFYRTVTYICHISVSLVREVPWENELFFEEDGKLQN